MFEAEIRETWNNNVKVVVNEEQETNLLWEKK